jgi:hypothetical protein
MQPKKDHAKSAFLACVLLACCGHSAGSPGSGSASVSGSIKGITIPTNNAVGVNGTTTVNGPTQPVAGAHLANVGNICTTLQMNQVPASSDVLDVSVVGATGAAAVAPGTYKLNAPGGIGGAVLFTVQDQNCVPTLQTVATVGSVTLTTVSSSTIAGTFDATFPTGDHVTGSFSAPVCAFNAADAAASACAQ